MEPQLALGPWWTCDHGAAQSPWGLRGHRDNSERERERRSSVFSPMVPLECGATEMDTRCRSTEAVGGALMER
jgi:hypothetical protein